MDAWAEVTNVLQLIALQQKYPYGVVVVGERWAEMRHASCCRDPFASGKRVVFFTTPAAALSMLPADVATVKCRCGKWIA